MRRLLLLLVLFSVAHPTVGSCNFSPEDAAAQQSLDTAFTFVSIAMGIAIVSVSLSYMVGKLTSNPQLLLFSKDEMAHLIITLLLLSSVIAIFEGSCVLMDNFLDIQGGISAAKGHMYNLQLEGKVIVRSLLKESVEEKFEAAWVAGYMLPIVGGETAFIRSYHTANARQYEILADMVTVGYVSAGVQHYALHFIESFVFPIMLPFGLVLRALPFVREAGNTIIALCFALLIIFPFAYGVNASANDVEKNFCDLDEERVMGDCTTTLGWGRISSYLFQTVFLPNLAMVVLVSGATAMVKASKVIS
ncbi:hypothetical protein JW721_01125 [Candidatus Micrarchaeota archaeon]|nr:hypothetical protein [Candidatus Micrarchaeota archaeon]